MGLKEILIDLKVNSKVKKKFYIGKIVIVLGLYFVVIY